MIHDRLNYNEIKQKATSSVVSHRHPHEDVSIIYESNSNDLYKKFISYKSEETVTLYANQRLDSILRDYYVILEYTKFFGSSKYCDRSIDQDVYEQYSADERFRKMFSTRGTSQRRYGLLDKCVYKNCFFTCDKEFTRHVDALLFHYGDMNNELRAQKSVYDDIVKERDAQQVWMLWHDEAYGTERVYDYLKFNWTISYYVNSDVSYFAYGGIVHTSNKSNETVTEEDIKKEYNRRNSSAIWFVSNCASKLRIEFTMKLGQHYPITINGGCKGTFSNVEKIRVDQNGCLRESDCEKDYLLNNKFYLAFESTNCSDYITEKFWRSLSFGLIPVVLQPSRQSYERVAPPNSFIHAQDFNYDATKLAQYLEKVSSNFTLYSKHLKWRSSYNSLYMGEDNEPRRLCQLCAKLNTERESIHYESMSSWLTQQCRLN